MTKKEEIEYKTEVVKLLGVLIVGGSITANGKTLTDNQKAIISYLLGQGLIRNVMPDKKSKEYVSMDDNDRAGRYRLLKESVFKAERIHGLFKTEVKVLLKGGS